MHRRELNSVYWLFFAVLLATSMFLLPTSVYALSSDTSLSTASVSFFGEHAYDYSGVSVASAGDVNGDGYADFLIGAWGNSEGGDDAGESYLILGKASGWARDTNLSTADASF
ncbi:MAG: integrin alpha, partial [Chloroflexi bacterium]|nr:integrin alpha [Chloroflexota bacterium]